MKGLPCQAALDLLQTEIEAAHALQSALAAFFQTWDWKDHSQHQLCIFSDECFNLWQCLSYGFDHAEAEVHTSEAFQSLARAADPFLTHCHKLALAAVTVAAKEDAWFMKWVQDTNKLVEDAHDKSVELCDEKFKVKVNLPASATQAGYDQRAENMTRICTYLQGGVRPSIDDRAAKLLANGGGIEGFRQTGRVAVLRNIRADIMKALKRPADNVDKLVTGVLAFEAKLMVMVQGSLISKNLSAIHKELLYSFLSLLVYEISTNFAKTCNEEAKVKHQLEQVRECMLKNSETKDL